MQKLFWRNHQSRKESLFMNPSVSVPTYNLNSDAINLLIVTKGLSETMFLCYLIKMIIHNIHLVLMIIVGFEITGLGLILSMRLIPPSPPPYAKYTGADPGFDRGGGAPDRDRPKLPTVHSSVV